MPITTDVVTGLTRATEDVLEEFEIALKHRAERERPIFKLIYNFNPEGNPSSSNDFGACSNLKDEIREYHRGGT